MRIISIQNISRRISIPEESTYLFFRDSDGESRIGKVIPFPLNIEELSQLLTLVNGLDNILVPDGFSSLPDGTVCLSIALNGHQPLQQGTGTLEELIRPIRSLHSAGMNHLSLDSNSWLLSKHGVPLLIFWGDGLFRIHSSAAPEVTTGGFPDALSDLYMLARSSTSRLFPDQEVLQDLRSDDYSRRVSAAEKLGFPLPHLPQNPFTCDIPEFSVVCGGDWRSRDALVNMVLANACEKGWLCRCLRKASGEEGRPLSDVPPGTVTTSPDQLLSNSFSGRSAIERLLVICDLASDQPDLAALLEKTRRVIPSGLHILITTTDETILPGTAKIHLQGKTTEAIDCSLITVEHGVDYSLPGPSWYGPRCRKQVMPETSIPAVHDFPGKALFREGAWLHTAANGTDTEAEERSESLLRLGRFQEALDTVPENRPELMGEILISLGRHEEAAELLKGRNPLLLSRALRGMGKIRKAIQVLSQTGKSAHLPELALLFDLAGEPAKALPLLTESIELSEGTAKIRILCALRNLETRLGMYQEALSHAEMAAQMSRSIPSIPLLVRSLQERGRTLIVAGRWREAEEDFKAAVTLHDENALFSERPPHIDLFDIQLRMGKIRSASTVFSTIEKLLKGRGIPSEQMLLMLSAYRGVLTGSGAEALPAALKAEELASAHGMELYSAISTLYAGRLYLQSGNFERGLSLLEKAGARGHLLGDRHLELLSEIEVLMARRQRGEQLQDIAEYTGELKEERLIMDILAARNIDSCFQELLDMPSPLTACRLADACGFPESPVIVRKLREAGASIANQLTEKEREKYSSLFPCHWKNLTSESISSREYALLLNKIAGWTSGYLEGEERLSSLAAVLGLEEIGIREKKGATKVPGKWPLYLTGAQSDDLAPLLVTVAATVSGRPEGTGPPRTLTKGTKLVGKSPAIRRIRHEIGRYAVEDVPVLIVGETGTGKEVCAREIHRQSGRSAGNFVAVDCGAIPENLMESELFGAAAGAYTGISTARAGLLHEATGGTLFLDEIGNLPIHMQVKLLRVLDSGRYRRLGESTQRTADIRVISATNTDLSEASNRGLFRMDLYYRLAVVKIKLPPLRERIEDIEALATHFTGKTFTAGALETLISRYWAGNARELRNVVKRAAILSTGSLIRSCDITPIDEDHEKRNIVTLKQAIRQHITATVKGSGGNVSLAARILECDPKTVRKHLRKTD